MVDDPVPILDETLNVHSVVVRVLLAPIQKEEK